MQWAPCVTAWLSVDLSFDHICPVNCGCPRLWHKYQFIRFIYFVPVERRGASSLPGRRCPLSPGWEAGLWLAQLGSLEFLSHPLGSWDRRPGLAY